VAADQATPLVPNDEKCDRVDEPDRPQKNEAREPVAGRWTAAEPTAAKALRFDEKRLLTGATPAAVPTRRGPEQGLLLPSQCHGWQANKVAPWQPVLSYGGTLVSELSS
jgi:hypothetical protein